MTFMRRTPDDISTIIAANAIEEKGGKIISIVVEGQATWPGALAPHSTFIVWFHADDELHARRIDTLTRKNLTKANIQYSL